MGIGARGSFGDTVTPVVWVSAVVLEGEDSEVVGKNPVVDGVWKARHKVVPDICLNDTPPLGSILNDLNRKVCGVEKLSAERRNHETSRFRMAFLRSVCTSGSRVTVVRMAS